MCARTWLGIRVGGRALELLRTDGSGVESVSAAGLITYGSVWLNVALDGSYAARLVRLSEV